MRLPCPERVSLWPVFWFAAVLAGLQIYEGTAPLFALGSFFFILVAAVGFNVAGGFTRPSGSYIFFFSVLGVIIGLTWKAVLGEPADSNLAVPTITITVYLCGICGLLVAAYISKKLTTRRALLADFVTDDNMQNATVGCMAVGLILTLVLMFVPHGGSGSVLSALNQLNHFLILSIFLGTLHTIRRSGGTRSVSLPILISGTFLFFTGILSFSKEGMITPFACWLFAAASQRYKVSMAQIAGGLLGAFILFQYLVPYSQYGRVYRADSFTEDVGVAFSLLGNLGYVREQFLESELEGEADTNDELAQGYFNGHQGFFDRLQMIGPDDDLNELTESGVVAGITPVYMAFANFVPHVIWPNKPTQGYGNIYAHQMGRLQDDDTTTGISFSPAGEAFHLMEWTGILILAPILWIGLFTLFDSLCGDVRNSPWGLLVVLVFSHYAPEGGIGGIIYLMGFLTLGILFAAVTVTYLTPIVGEILIGPNKKKTIHFLNTVRNRPGRIHPIGSSQGIVN